MQQEEPEFVAAVDMGSNSFHMIVSSINNGKLRTIDRIKEMVRLASGLDKHNYLDDETQDRALACLERFGQRIHRFPRKSVRVVGTNTLRTAKNSPQFIKRAEAALGHPIHIISGVEEARLIYQGVAHSLESDDAGKRFVMDIGGGSTEYIIGTGIKPKRKESLSMGCVSMSKKFFKKGKLSNSRMQNAILFAEQYLEPIQLDFSNNNWDEAIGASGTLRSVDKILDATGWSKNGITLDGLQKLVRYISTQKHIDNLDLPELDPERTPVFPGGVAILYATFLSLGIKQMTVSDGALREGLVHDLLGRIYNKDIRSDSVATLAKRYHTDTRHSDRIKQTLGTMLKQIDQSKLPSRKRSARWLNWAAELHEIGYDIAHNQYHKHSAYIIANADLAGFSKQNQILLSTLVLCHRKKISLNYFKDLPDPWNRSAIYLAILLRLAVVLHRNRYDEDLPDFKTSLNENNIHLQFENDFLQGSPLTNADLKQEAEYLESAGFNLTFS